MITFTRLKNGRGDDYTTGYLLNYPYFKMIAIYLSTQQAIDADPTVIQQINFTGKLDRPGSTKS